MGIHYLLALGCVAGLSLGQILFKMAANALQQGGAPWQHPAASCLVLGFSLYGITSLAWVWILREVELSRIYPLMALAFVMVPIAAHFQFGETLDTRYFLGVALIVTGVCVIASR
jgi:drug/metabolite transporter (DMT)-like permease